MALEAMGWKITIGSLNPPTSSFRHERLRNLQAEMLYPPPKSVLDLPLTSPPNDADWHTMAALAQTHDSRYGKSFKSLTRARNARHFAHEFRRRGIRHIHVHFANRATHTALFLKAVGFTFSFTAHAQDFMLDLGSDDLLREMAREAEFVIAVSDFSQDLLQKTCPDSAEKIHRVYNGLDIASFSPTPLPQGDPLRIISIGRLIDFKGFPDLIEAVRQLHLEGVSVHLDIIGEGPQRSALERQIADGNLAGVVHLLGLQSQDRIRERLEAAHVFALGCIVDDKGASDILPTVILEAMAAGRPVVSTRLVGVPEMVEHGRTGLLAEPKSPTELAEHLKTIATQRNLAEEMGTAGRMRFENMFTLKHSAGQLAQYFAAVVPNTPSAKANDRLLCLTPHWPQESAEWSYLHGHSGVTLLSANAIPNKDLPIHPAPNQHFLPDAMVLESHWRNHPELAGKLEALYEKCGTVDGEGYFREARRAVWTALQLRHWGCRQVHALRSDAVLWAWMVKKLTGCRASFAVEAKPVLSRSCLEVILQDFDTGSLSDPRIAEKLGSRFPDLLRLVEPTRKPGLFSKKENPVDPAGVWESVFTKLPSP
jgi:glycosyltransferase involved in cell wall biosynthesis